ncbi:hypothetical protein [Tenacibaculum amylolyticum]|uniref:hypothetical protein n=1 Tax=Tenacibaculum amylolyticum TaxID=104269 RepID=UPI0038946039
MKKENLQCYLTEKVVQNQRVFKIVDGLHRPMSKAKVFYIGYTPNLGETVDDFIAMGKEIEKQYEQWYHKNKDMLRLYYTN